MKLNISDKIRQNGQLIVFVILLAALYSFLFRNLSIDKMWAFGDLMPFPSNVSEATDRFLYVWQNQYLGYPFFSKPYHLFIGVLVFILGNAIITQKILFLSLMPFSGFCMYLLVKRFVWSEVGRYFASILYSLNPHTIGLFIDGKIIALLYYSTAPLLILQFLKMFEEKNRVQNVLIFSVLFGLFFHNLYAAFWVIIPFVTVYILVEFFIGKNKRSLLFRVAPTVLTALSLGVLLQAPSVNQIVYIKGSIPVEEMMNYVDYSYSKAAIPNLIRLAGNAGNRMDTLGYNKVQWWTIFGFVISFLAFSSLFFLRDENKKMRVRICLVCTTLIVLICGFAWLTSIRVTYPLFYAFPYLFSLRNLNKLMHPLLLAFSVLAGVGLDGILTRIMGLSLNKSKVHRVLVLSFFCFILISMGLYVAPVVWTGDMVLSEVRCDGYIVPDSYYDIANWINERKQSQGFFRTLWLPYMYETKVSTQLRLNWLDPAHVGIRHGGGEQIGIPEWQINLVEGVFRAIYEQKTVYFGKILAIMSVKYVLVDLTSDVGRCEVTRRYGAPFISGNSSYFIEFLNRQNDLKPVYSNESFIIYENAEPLFSHVSIYDRSIFVVGPSQISSLLALSDLPRLNFSDYLIFFERGLPKDKAFWKLNISDVVVFAQSSPSRIKEYSDYTRDKRVLLVYEGGALRSEHGTLALDFAVPNEGFYKIAFKGSSEDAEIDIDSSISARLSFKSYGEISSFHLNNGVHRLEIKSAEAILEKVVIFSTTGNETLEDIFLLDGNSSNKLEEIHNVGEQITFRASLEKPSFIVLSESYHDSWKAYVRNEEIKHMRASFWANGFYVSATGDLEVRITLELQRSRNLTIAIWVASWVAVLIGFTVISLLHRWPDLSTRLKDIRAMKKPR